MAELAEYLKRLADGQIPSEAPPECEVREELSQLVAYLGEISHFTRSMADGDLSATLRLRGSLAGALKGLHANLRHLTWQTQEVAAGDFTQRVDFLGEFSGAFNHMVEALAKARDDLTSKNTELEKALAELKATQSQLLQQEKMASVGQLAAGVAHEINNPMGFIISNLGTLRNYGEALKEYLQATDAMLANCSEADRAKMQALQNKLDLSFLMEDMPSLIKESRDGAERVRIIVQSLRNFSAVDQEGTQSININDYLDSTVNVAWSELKDKAEIVRSYGVLPPILGRTQEIGQVFLNILRNSVQAIAGRGIIHLKTSHDNGMVTVAITDNGCGIPPEVIGRIFEPFFTTRPPGHGTGLGLSTCYDIVKKHGGTIDVTSTVGKGTKFTIRLPVGGAG
jgi:two-component system, NtrC family, sensor kinase